jgi:hypothetical protein
VKQVGDPAGDAEGGGMKLHQECPRLEEAPRSGGVGQVASLGEW